MRVAMVCPYAWDVPGGVQSHIAGLAAALTGRGHEVEVLTPDSLDHRNKALYQFAKEQGIGSYDGMDVGPAHATH